MTQSASSSRINNDVESKSKYLIAFERFRNHKLGVIGVAIVVLYIFVALFGSLIAPRDPTATEAAVRHSSPSLEYPFGTDHQGRDVLSRTIVGAQPSLQVATVSVGLATILGVPLGLIAGYFRGYVDEAVMRSVDILLAFPSILLALVVIAIIGSGLQSTTIALGIAYTPILIRITRGSVLSVVEEEYITAAVAYGERSWRLMYKEILPNILPTLIVQITITFAFAILVEASLSYLGLGAQPPTVTWGTMISDGQTYILINSWMSFFPGISIVITVLGLTFLGVGLRDTFDPANNDPVEGDIQ